jgi:hypothetical protein
MTRMILDEATAARLSAADSGAELFDPGGHLIGYFTRPDVREASPAEYDKIKSPLTEEEVQRRLVEPGGTTLDEIWKRLGVR